MLTKDFYFDLPEELIAQYPADKRGDDRLLLLDKATGYYKDLMINDFPSLLDENSIIVVNNSKVRKARLFGETENSGLVEFLFLEESLDHTWITLASKIKKQKVGRRYFFKDSDGNIVKTATLIKKNDDSTLVLSFDSILDEEFFLKLGHVPLPPYIKREDSFADESRYQTVYSKNLGSVASPTAGLHFTPEVLDKIKAKGIKILEVTLHVGPGTFLPVRSESIQDHHMHFERYTIDENVANELNEAKRCGKKIIAIGTTTVRTLESATNEQGILESGTNRTNIFIYPGYRFKFVDSLFTNFHTPESTLLMLVSAFSTKEYIFNAYKHAIDEKYHFFSYGDAMFIR